MPQIKGYNQQVDIAKPRQTRRAVSDDFGFGKDVSNLGQEVLSATEVVNRRQEQDEINNVSVAISKAHADFNIQLDNELQKGTINEEKLMEKFDDHISNVGEGVSTSGGHNYLERSSAALKSNLLQLASAGKAEIAGQKAKQDYLGTLSNFSTGLMGDPSSYETVSQIHDDYLNSLVTNGSLPASAVESLRAHGKSELAKSSIRGWISLQPHETKKALENGQWDTSIDGNLKNQLIGESEREIYGREVERERIQRAQEKALELQRNTTQNDFLEKMEKGTLSYREILDSNLEAFGSGSKEQFLKMLKQANSDKIKTDDNVFIEVFNRVHLPDGDPDKITDENILNSYLGKGLTLTDIKNLRSEMQGKGTIAGKNSSMLKTQLMNFAKSKLTRSNPMIGIKDAEGDANLASFQAFFIEEYQKQRKLGKSDIQLLSPDSDDYLGQYIGNYIKTPSQIMKDNLKSIRPQNPISLPDGRVPGRKKVPIREDGESIEQWEKRIKGN